MEYSPPPTFNSYIVVDGVVGEGLGLEGGERGGGLAVSRATTCLTRDFDDRGRMFYCELDAGHDGRHHRERKSGYSRAYLRDAVGVGLTFHQVSRRR